MNENKITYDGKSGLSLVLSRSYWLGTIMLWLAYFMGLVIFYALINWMPVLFNEAGLSVSTGTLIAALFPLGGVGAVLLGWLMDRFNATRMIAISYMLTALSIWWIGHTVTHQGWLVVSVFVAGTMMNTTQSSLPALAATYYPTRGRATGVAWMLGVGRFGGIAGSFLVAWLAAFQLAFSGIFAVLAVPAVIATLALLVKQAAGDKAPEEPAGLQDVGQSRSEQT